MKWFKPLSEKEKFIKSMVGPLRKYLYHIYAPKNNPNGNNVSSRVPDYYFIFQGSIYTLFGKYVRGTDTKRFYLSSIEVVSEDSAVWVVDAGTPTFHHVLPYEVIARRVYDAVISLQVDSVVKG